ncbi:MAG TPA: patatin-like phospholipase family protein [Rhizomicrobium sp.]|nr:patatin-like phospholipase family protein [Rhizomicrobium sp.]
MLAQGRIVFALVVALALSGCVGGGTEVMNQALSPALLQGEGPISQGGYRAGALSHDRAPSTLVMLSFSGGGKRSAAFGYGVLKGLRDYSVAIDGSQKRLLDTVDIMSSVSGGSFPAAYYGLYHDKIFTDFEKDFLDQDVESYIYGSYLLPWRFAKALFNPNYGTNDRMAEVYDNLMFHGATFADLKHVGRPLVSINATDVDTGLEFMFVQDQFDLICSDLLSYPVARAVAASNGFPILFNPITLKSYRPQCNGRVPAWIRADKDKDNPLSRTHELARSHSLYLDAERTKYVHLLDGGIADNLALRGITNMAMVLSGDIDDLGGRFDLGRIRRIVLISADGQAENDTATAKQIHLTGLGQLFNVVSGTQIDRYNYETMILARQQLDTLREAVKKERCEKGQHDADGLPCEDVQVFFAHLSLGGITDKEERERLAKIPTGLTIDAADVAQLVAAGEAQVKQSPDLAAFRDSLLPVGRPTG